MKTALLYLLLTIFPGLLFSQSLINRVVASGGDYSESSNFKLSYTVGDVLTDPFQNQSVLFTTGFQQTWDISVGIDDVTGEILLVAFPNPVEEKLRIRFGQIEDPELVIEIISLSGTRLFYKEVAGPFSGRIEEFDISHLNSGVYILRITASGRGAIKTVKLIKR